MTSEEKLLKLAEIPVDVAISRGTLIIFLIVDPFVTVSPKPSAFIWPATVSVSEHCKYIVEYAPKDFKLPL